MKNIFNVLLVVLLVLTAYNTYSIQTMDAPESVDLTEVNAKINGNAAEIQTLETNMATMVDFVNAKFENLQSSETVSETE